MTKDEMKMTFTQTITREEMKNRISMALKDPILQQGFEIICKENAELKEELKDANVKVVHLSCNQNKDLKRNITKAKEIIKTLADDLSTYSGSYQKELLEAEQFLKEIEE